jgi:hypothetical protein
LCVKLRVTSEFEVCAPYLTKAASLRRNRYHVVQEFNKGVYDYIIATDEGGNEQDEESGDSGPESQEEDEKDCASLRISMCQPHPFLIPHAFFSSA